jgi:hypothetical protein
MVKAKIICTLGPSSSSKTVLNKMMHAGTVIVLLYERDGRVCVAYHVLTLIWCGAVDVWIRYKSY